MAIPAVAAASPVVGAALRTGGYSGLALMSAYSGVAPAAALVGAPSVSAVGSGWMGLGADISTLGAANPAEPAALTTNLDISAIAHGFGDAPAGHTPGAAPSASVRH